MLFVVDRKGIWPVRTDTIYPHRFSFAAARTSVNIGVSASLV